MVENGFVFAVQKAIIKNKKKELKQDNKTDKLRMLFQKYNVSYAETFSIKNWTITDLKLLEKVTLYKLSFATLNDNEKMKF